MNTILRFLLLTLLLSSSPLLAQDDHGDTFATATPLTLGVGSPGAINPSSDLDYFQIILPTTGPLVLESTGSLDTMGTLYDSAGTQLAFEDDISSSNFNFRISRTSQAAGTYYLLVESYNNSLTGSYNVIARTDILTLDRTVVQLDETGGSATVNVTASGAWAWSFTANPDSFASSIEISPQTGNQAFTVSAAALTGPGPRVATVTFTLGALSQVLTIRQDYDSPDGFPDAQPITRGSYPLAIETAGDQDYFIINHATDGPLNLTATGTLDTEGWIYDSTQTEVAYSDDEGPARNFLLHLPNAAAGTYYLRVRAFSPTVTGQYSLLYDDHGNLPAASTPFSSLGAEAIHQIEYGGDVDFFVINHPGGPFNVSSSGTTDLEAFLLNSSFADVDYSDDVGEDTNFLFDIPNLAAGTYYLEVSGFSTQDIGPYSLVTANLNLTKATESAETQGGEFSVGVACPGEWIWEVPETWVTSTLATTQTGNQTFTYSVAPLPAGVDNRVAVIYFQYNGDEEQLTITQIRDDHGASPATATLISGSGPVTGNLINPTDRDYLRIDVPQDSLLIAWTESPVDTILAIYDAAGTLLKSNDDLLAADESFLPNNNSRVSARVSAGANYLAVTGYDGETGLYTVHYSILPNSAPLQHTMAALGGPNNSLFGLGFPTVAGTTYEVYASTDLQAWTLLTTVTGDGLEKYYFDPVGTKRYFRVKVPTIP